MTRTPSRLKALLREGERLAARFPDTPVIAGQLLSEHSGQRFTCTIPLPEVSMSATVTFNDGRFGAVSGDDYSVGFALNQIDCAVVVEAGKSNRFGVVLINEGLPIARSKGYQAWKQFAESAAPVLWSIPQVRLEHLPQATAALTAFVFRSVYGTAFVTDLAPFLVIENLWGATLHAISQEIERSQSPAVADSTNQPDSVSLACESDPTKTVRQTEAVANNVELGLQSIKGWSRLNNRQQKILRCLWEHRNSEVSFHTLMKLPDVFKIDISEDGIKKAIDRIKRITELDITVRLKPQKCRLDLPDEDRP